MVIKQLGKIVISIVTLRAVIHTKPQADSVVQNTMKQEKFMIQSIDKLAFEHLTSV